MTLQILKSNIQTLQSEKNNLMAELAHFRNGDQFQQLNARFTEACNENHKIILDARKLNEQLNQANNARTALEREVQQQMQQMRMAHGADQANWERNMQVMRNNVQLLTQRNQQLNNLLAHFQRQTGSPLFALDLSIADGGSVYNPDVNMIGHPKQAHV